MTDPKQTDPKPETANGAEAPPHPTSLAEPDAQASVEAPEPFTELENLYAENAGLKDKILRTLAEMENLRRRTEKEVADAKAYGVTAFARDMLGFADNLARALAAVPAEARAAAAPQMAGFVEGMEVTGRDFAQRLARHGVKKLEPQGQKFDPNMHEALFEIPDESVATGTVLQVVEDGYAIGERCLRPAKVGVSRGGPKA